MDLNVPFFVHHSVKNYRKTIARKAPKRGEFDTKCRPKGGKIAHTRKPSRIFPSGFSPRMLENCRTQSKAGKLNTTKAYLITVQLRIQCQIYPHSSELAQLHESTNDNVHVEFTQLSSQQQTAQKSTKLQSFQVVLRKIFFENKSKSS